MDKAYIDRLSPDILQLVAAIESDSGLEIGIEVDSSRAGMHPGEPDPLACSVTEHDARIFIPSHDYFPEESVLHELLHIQRFLVDHIPQVSVCDSEWCPELESVFTQLDNHLEHLILVPLEVRIRHCRRERWSTVVERVLRTLQMGDLAVADRDFLAIYLWVFSGHTLQQRALESSAHKLLEQFALVDRAHHFRNAILPALADKEAMVRACVEHFQIRPEVVCLEYLDPRAHTRRQACIP